MKRENITSLVIGGNSIAPLFSESEQGELGEEICLPGRSGFAVLRSVSLLLCCLVLPRCLTAVGTPAVTEISNKQLTERTRD